MGMEFLFGGDKNITELDSGDSTKTTESYSEEVNCKVYELYLNIKNSLSCILKINALYCIYVTLGSSSSLIVSSAPPIPV